MATKKEANFHCLAEPAKKKKKTQFRGLVLKTLLSLQSADDHNKGSHMCIFFVQMHLFFLILNKIDVSCLVYSNFCKNEKAIKDPWRVVNEM